MTVKVKIRDFQSIDEIELEISRFTIIVGQSNIGKSSLQRSIGFAFHNEAGDWFVRDGRNSTNVLFEDGTNQIEWQKGKGLNRYVINGSVYEKVGMDVPPALVDLGYTDLIVDEDRYSVQIADQFDPPFMVRQSPTKVGAIYSKLTKTDILSKATTFCARDLKAVKQEANLREQDLKDLEAQVKELTDIPAWVKKVKLIEAETETLSEKCVLCEDKKQVLKEIKSLEALLRFGPKISSVQVPVPNLDKLQAKVQRLKVISLRAKANARKLLALTELTKVVAEHQDLMPTLQRKRLLQELLKRWEQKQSWLTSAQQISTVTVPSLANAKRLAEERQKLQEQYLRVQKLQKRRKVIEIQLAEIDNELFSADLDLTVQQEELESFSNCPLCERQWGTHEHEKLLEAGA